MNVCQIAYPNVLFCYALVVIQFKNSLVCSVCRMLQFFIVIHCHKLHEFVYVPKNPLSEHIDVNDIEIYIYT